MLISTRKLSGVGSMLSLLPSRVPLRKSHGHSEPPPAHLQSRGPDSTVSGTVRWGRHVGLAREVGNGPGFGGLSSVSGLQRKEKPRAVLAFGHSGKAGDHLHPPQPSPSVDWDGGAPASGLERITPNIPHLHIYQHTATALFKLGVETIPMCYVVFAFLGEEELLQGGG